VDHPYLVIYSNTKREGMDAVGSGSATGVIANTSVPASLSGPISACAICNEDPEMPVTAECGHIFCHACVKDLIETVDDGPGIVLECPECSQPLTVDLQPEDELQPPQKQQLQGKGHKGCSGSGSRRAIIPAGKFQMSSTLKSSIINRIDLSKFQSSTKLEALMQELHSMMERDPAAKAIVFSQ
jgi:DNA repair protein RAD16